MIKRSQIYLSTIAPDSASAAREQGFGLEIAEYCTAYNMDDHFKETDLSVREKLTDISRRVFHGPFNELFPCAIDPLARKLAAYRYRQAIALANQYGAEKIVIHGGYNPKIYYPCWYTEQSILFWKEFLKTLDGTPLPGNVPLSGNTPLNPDITSDRPVFPVICLENVLEEEPGMLLDIVRGVGDPRLRLCLDVGHVNAYSSIPVSQWLESMAPWLSHFHLHNNTGEYDAHQSLDDGSIDMAEFFRKADVLYPQATYTLEVMEAAPSVCWMNETLALDDKEKKTHGNRT